MLKKKDVCFRISNDTGKCEMGNITANAMENPNGIMVYVKSGIPVKSCVISPSIGAEYNTHSTGK